MRAMAASALAGVPSARTPDEVVVHRRYNPEGITQYNVVPGLMGVILTMTLVMMTAMGMTRERERGTLENLLATPVKPVEVMIGKILPYVLIGYVQVLMIYTASRWLFGVPMFGSLLVLGLGACAERGSTGGPSAATSSSAARSRSSRC